MDKGKLDANAVDFEKRFLAAQGAMHHAPKLNVNPYHSSKYADYKTVLDVVKKPLHDNGISYRHTSRFLDGLWLVGTKLVCADTGYQSESFEIPVTPGKPQDQGSAITYARRYTLSAICGIAADDDDDGNQSEKSNSAHNRQAPSTSKQPPQKASTPKTASIYKGTSDQQNIIKEHLKKKRVPADLWEAVHNEMLNRPSTHLNKVIENVVKNS